MMRLFDQGEIDQHGHIKKDVLRDWRRRGLLGSAEEGDTPAPIGVWIEGRWLYKAGEVARLIIAKWLNEKFRLDLRDSLEIAEHVSPYLWARLEKSRSRVDELFLTSRYLVAQNRDGFQVTFLCDLSNFSDTGFSGGVVLDFDALAAELKGHLAWFVSQWEAAQ